jgi:hypothetical protein
MMATTGILPGPHCGFCGITEKLLRCSRCKVISYCSTEHQAAHRPDHKSGCNAVAKKSHTVDKEEQELRSHPADVVTPADVFTNGVGHFWGFLATRPYMRSRFALVGALQQVKTFDSVQAQLDHLLDMLRLCRGDNMGLRAHVPALMLRLNRDQESYDFVKWYATTENDPDYDWGNMDMPYLSVKDADVFEPVEYLCDEWGTLSFIVAITLLKVKLLLDLKALEWSRSLDTKVPTEILDIIQQFVPRSPIILGNRDILGRRDHTAAIASLTAQVDLMYENVQTNNMYFWEALLEPGSHLTARPGEYSHGSIEEMQLALQHSYLSWVEMPGAVELIRIKVRGDRSCGHIPVSY